MALLVGGSGASLALLAFGRSVHRIGPFDVELFSRPGTGGSEIFLPPLGSIEADTHLVPLLVTATLRQVDGEAAARAVRAGGMRSLVSTIQDQTPGALRAHAGRSLAIGAAGALVFAALLYGRKPGTTRATLAGVAVMSLLAAGLYWTYRPGAFDEATYTGSLSAARDVVGPLTSAGARFEGFREDLDRLVRGSVRAYGVIGGTDVHEDAVTVLHISDVHSSPLGMDLAQRLAAEFEVDVVVDTGDLTSFGSAVEAPILERIPAFGVPYLFVRGNHDSAASGAQAEATQNGETLEREGVTVAGVRFFGAGHPLFTPGPAPEVDGEIEAAVVGAGLALADAVVAEPVPPDVVLVHDGRMADPVVGTVPLVLSGHFHSFAGSVEEGTIRLRVGSTGAGGLDTFLQDELLPLAAQLLYLEGTPPRLVAVDRVTLDPETRALTVDRELVEVPTASPSQAA